MADLVAYDDLDAFGSECATPLDELEQDLWHRIIEAPGSNLDDPDRGFGLYRRLSAPLDPHMGTLLQLELQKDDRVDQATVTVTGPVAGQYTLQIDVVADGAALGITAVLNPANGTATQVIG